MEDEELREKMTELAETFPCLRGAPGVSPFEPEELNRWAPLVVRLVGTMLVAAASVAPDHAVVPDGRASFTVVYRPLRVCHSRARARGSAVSSAGPATGIERSTGRAAALNSVTASTESLQNPGGIGLGAYLTGSATNAPIVASFDDLRAEPNE